ncbi:uncharacterized protein B0I36DRAFT_61654 [Microdochium trichocladiopsis]|uniref:Zn(2)-C6 fungal-type domain-containing protein n=1 Tax=Microdochium trichocladiopsis TaxID=1682393 RepID=A0A9P9BU02_9PEZI|nr:uncharacterized protein B0I36DRAFT_61654 [Microdochium trichocladiopsis]KAH7037091.1 hypothetical protein B0I36DRAFT_61654 [Microdochium trichocladiopsis]
MINKSDLLRRHAARHEADDIAAAGGLAAVRKTRACDACRANKTRCSGNGPQCTLCTKRGVECTFQDDDRTGTNTAVPGDPLNQGTTPSSTVSMTASTAGSLENRLNNLPPALVEFLHSCSVQPNPSKPHPEPVSFGRTGVTPRLPSPPAYSPVTDSGSLLDAVYELLISSNGSSYLGSNMAASPRFEAWVTSCANSYFEWFHPRWPVMHAPSTSMSSSSISLVAIILMVGCWFQDKPEDKPAVWRMFNLMMKIGYEKLPMCASKAKTGPWPLDIFQGMLILVVFGMSWGDDETLVRSSHLCSLLVSVLRGTGLFSKDEMEYQKEKYQPGTWAPFVLARDEHWKQLAMSLYFVDNYLSIILGTPPAIEGDELFERVVASYALWNAHPIPTHTVRMREEPAERSMVTMDAIACGEAGPTAWSLFEDARLAYCGLQHTIWRHNQRRQRQRRKSAVVDEVASLVLRDATLKHLDAWAMRLNRLIIDCADQAAQMGHGDLEAFPLAAYRGGENHPGKERWRGTPLQRAMAQGYECALLYHLLSMRLCMHPTLFGAGAGLWQPWSRMGAAMTMDGAEDAELQRWAMSDDGRRALWHAMAALKFVEKEGVRHGYPRAHQGHLEDAAVSSSVTVVGRWMVSNTETVPCDPRTGEHHGVRVEDPWKQTESPARLMDEVETCMCQLEQWLAEWHAKALRAHDSVS